MSSQTTDCRRVETGRPDSRSLLHLSPSLRIAEVVTALSQALDLGSGSSAWHSVRTCIIGMRIAAELRLPENVRDDLYYALLLKDAGCSSNSAQFYPSILDSLSPAFGTRRADSAQLSWEALEFALAQASPGKNFRDRVESVLRVAARRAQHSRDAVAIRCERGRTLARLMGLPEQTARALGGIAERWNGDGHPKGLSGQQIPITSRIILLSQTLDTFFTGAGPEAALKVACERSRSWFDPEVVKAARSLTKRGELWADLWDSNLPAVAVRMEPRPKTISDGRVTLDAICRAFATIVDAKSPFTFKHSNGVANAAVAIATQLRLEPHRILFVRHAALLHDLGKMAVANTILLKTGTLNAAEWQIIRAHPEYTWKILRAIPGFEEMSEVAASHHERLDGSGYFRGLSGSELSTEARILMVADIFDALSAKRPYRDAMPLERVFEIIRRHTPQQFDGACVEALEQSGIGGDQTFRDLDSLQNQLGVAVRPAPLPSESIASQNGHGILRQLD
jgi:putative nucleotidyltransferase with HDIG domain